MHMMFLAFSGMLVHGQSVLYPLSATIAPSEDGIQVVVVVDLSIGCPPFSHVLTTEEDTVRIQACYFTTGVFNMAGCFRSDTVNISAADLDACPLMVDFNEVGHFTSPSVDTIPRGSMGPFTVCAVSMQEHIPSPLEIGMDEQGHLTAVTADALSDVILEVLDLTGRAIFLSRRTLQEGVNSLDLPELPLSLYVVRITSGTDRWHRVVMKQ